MMTKNMENLLAMVPLSCATEFGQLRVMDVSGRIRYLTGNFSKYPYERTASLTTTAENAGISIGTGGTAATMEDYQLEETVTSGVSLTLTSTIPCMVARGSSNHSHPAVVYTITVTNNRSAELVIREIGYKQKVRGVQTPGGTTAADVVVLLDRTVLESPVTIQPGDAGVIEYTIFTHVRGQGSQSGVALVDFTYGSDEAVAAMIDAANAGTIDLHRDGGWLVGDIRTIHLDAWTGGGDTAHAAQNVNIVITSFEDYNQCGCVMQFDFCTLVSEPQRMNATDSNNGGYGASEMFSDTLPALVEALPSWLKTRLKTFSVVVGKGNVDAVETVSGNKLALRSPTETDDQYGKVYAAAGEGEALAFYSEYLNRKKDYPGTSASNGDYWYRSPAKNSNTSFVEYYNSAATGAAPYATSQKRIAPFGCL